MAHVLNDFLSKVRSKLQNLYTMKYSYKVLDLSYHLVIWTQIPQWIYNYLGKVQVFMKIIIMDGRVIKNYATHLYTYATIRVVTRTMLWMLSYGIISNLSWLTKKQTN